MIRGLLKAIGRALRFMLRLPFALLNVAFGGSAVDDYHDDVIQPDDVEAAGIDEVTDVKRWMADVIAGRHAVPCSGRLAGWSRAMDRDAVEMLAKAAVRGKLEAHLSDEYRVLGVPPVGNFHDTREWLVARDKARRRLDIIEASAIAKAKAIAPRSTRPRPTPAGDHDRRHHDRATPDQAELLQHDGPPRRVVGFRAA